MNIYFTILSKLEFVKNIQKSKFGKKDDKM